MFAQGGALNLGTSHIKNSNFMLKVNVNCKCLNLNSKNSYNIKLNFYERSETIFQNNSYQSSSVCLHCGGGVNQNYSKCRNSGVNHWDAITDRSLFACTHFIMNASHKSSLKRFLLKWFPKLRLSAQWRALMDQTINRKPGQGDEWRATSSGPRSSPRPNPPPSTNLMESEQTDNFFQLARTGQPNKF